MKVLIDNGHGENTLGKCSPDKRIREYKWARDVADLLVKALKAQGIEAERIVTEETDISLKERTRRVNTICAINKNVILISLHLNASGADGKWHNASGWSGWIAPKASEKSKRLASLLLDEAIRLGLKGNRAIPNEKYWVGNFAIVRDTKCPAVLTENLFQDNEGDCKVIESAEGKQKIVTLHVNAIKEYIKTYGG
jgi:N-acetylmuramoyl-L-alanine amidase